MKKIRVQCPCGESGLADPREAASGIQCPACGIKFIAHETWLDRQLAGSPILRIWWLLPAVALFVMFYLGAPLWLYLFLIILTAAARVGFLLNKRQHP